MAKPKKRPSTRAAPPAPPNPFATRARPAPAHQASRSRTRANVFTDRRIGESDPRLPQDARYLARLQRERSRRSVRRARFSLTDAHGPADAHPDGSVHANADADADARPFSMLKDDYDDVEADDAAHPDGNDPAIDDSDDGELLTLKAPASDDDAPGAQRTHREIMAEVMQKSKQHRAERQHEKHEADAATTALDGELPSLLELLSRSARDQVATRAAAPHGALFAAGEAAATRPKLGEALPQAVGAGFRYEDVYRELAAERRARPSDRLLTEEERALQERDRLLVMERRRLARMADLEGGDSEEEAQRGGKRKRAVERKGADDLDDDFQLGDEKEDDDDDDEEDGEEETASVATRPIEEASDDESSDDEKAQADTKLVQLDTRKLVVADVTIADEDIPFVYAKCPSKPSELQDLFEGTSISQRGLIMERMRKGFAVSLNPAANIPKLEKLLECVLLRLEGLAKSEAVDVKNAVGEMDMLLVHVHSFGERFEQVTCRWARNKLAEFFTSLQSSDGKGLTAGWDASTLLIARAIGRLFPGSDMRHPVCTPLVLLLSEALSVKRMKSAKDLALAMFVGTVLVEQMAESARYSGQLTTLLCEILRALCGVEGSVLQPLFKEWAKKPVADSPLPRLELSDCMQSPDELKSPLYMELRVVHAVEGLVRACTFDGRLPNMDIAFWPVRKLKIPVTSLQEVLSNLFATGGENRVVLTLYAKTSNVVISKSLNPKFTAENGVFRKRPKTSYHARMNGDMSESAKRIRRAVRKEERGFARDVRRDAGLAAKDSLRLEQERYEDREKKTRAAMSFLEQQQATWRQAEKRQNKLSGKKW